MEETAEKRPRKRPLPGPHLMDKLDTLLSPRRPPPESVTLRRSAVGLIGSRETDAMPLSFQNLYTETAYVALPWFDPDCNPDPWRRAAGMPCRAIDGLNSTSAEKDGMASSAVCRCRPIIQPTNSEGENSE